MIDTMEHQNGHGNNIVHYEANADATQQLICHCSFLRIHSIFFISDDWKKQKVSKNLHNQKEKNVKCHQMCWTTQIHAMFIKWNIFHEVESFISNHIIFLGCKVKIHLYWYKIIWLLVHLLEAIMEFSLLSMYYVLQVLL